jgi:hypothetical protein
MNTFQEFNLTGKFTLIATTTHISTRHKQLRSGGDGKGTAFFCEVGASANQVVAGMMYYAVSKNGNNTTFKTPDYVTINDASSSIYVPLGSQNYLLDKYHFTAHYPIAKNDEPQFFTAGIRKIIGCAGTYQNTYFGSDTNENRYLLDSFIKSYPEGSYFYSSTHQLTNTGIIFKGYTYLGYAPNGTDLINRSGASLLGCSQHFEANFLFTSSINYAYSENGVLSAANWPNVGAPYRRSAVLNGKIKPGAALNCNVVDVNSGYFYSTEYNCLNPNLANSTYNWGYFDQHASTDIPRIDCYYSVDYGKFLIVGQDNDYLVFEGCPTDYAPSYYGGIAGAFLGSDGGLFIITYDNISSPTWRTYWMDLTEYLAKIPHGQQKIDATPLINYHRPVSAIKGGFIS